MLAPLKVQEVRAATVDGEGFTFTGYAAVFDTWATIGGAFKERLARGAFKDVLGSPDLHVVACWDHDTRWTLASTANRTLRLSQDPRGLAFEMDVAPTTYAEDLAVLLRRGDVSQASFMFAPDVASEEWGRDDAGMPTRTIKRIAELYDVTITARGAYREASSAVRTVSVPGTPPATVVGLATTEDARRRLAVAKARSAS